MRIKEYQIKITGESPLLMHNDNLKWADMMKTWSIDPANKKNSVAGDDRTPAFRWIGTLYEDKNVVVIPADNLMTVLREGGAKCPTGKGRGTFKAQTQSGIIVNEFAWPLVINGGSTIPMSEIKPLINESDFAKHEEKCQELGFELFVKRAKINNNKHVRVRPKFVQWQCEGSVMVVDEAITKDVLVNILIYAGRYSGLGDWRPSAPKSPGAFGRFTATVN